MNRLLKRRELKTMRTIRWSRLLGTAVLVFVTGTSYGCEEFLDVGAKGALDENTLGNLDGVEGSLIATYRMLERIGDTGGWASAASNWVWGSVPSDDAYKGSEASDQPFITDVELYAWSTGAVDGGLNDQWRKLYEGISRANATIRLLDKVVEADPDEISGTDQDGIRGEAIFLRAHYHFEAWRLWGNVPYYTDEDTDFRKSNQGGDVVTSLISDLQSAISLLGNNPRNGQVGRVTRWTAQAYKGRVEVYAAASDPTMWTNALGTLRDVRGSGPYDLQDNFFEVYTGFSQYQNGPETIFAFQASSNDGEPDGLNANWGETLNFPHGGSPFGCCGFHQPTQNMVNYFRVDANGLPMAITSPGTWNNEDAEYTAAFTADPAVLVDPRLDWTVGRDDVPYKDWGSHADSWIRSQSYGGPYSPKKAIYEKNSGAMSNVGWNSVQLSSMNIHVFRYADMLLLLAEAEVEVGNIGNALDIVNEIRTRAGEKAQGAGTDEATIAVDIDDATITWANYSVEPYPSFPDQDYARAAVRAERRLELSMEGERFFDLKRWGMLQQVMNEYLAKEATRRPFLAAAQAVDAKYDLYPIPITQIELSQVAEADSVQDRLVQNPGW
jgi:hypothetical protein